MLRRILTGNRDLAQIQDHVDQALAPLQQIPMAGGNVLTNISLSSSGVNNVAHKLGRKPQYWIILDQNNNSVVWRPQNSDDNYLYLSCSANCTVSLWVN